MGALSLHYNTVTKRLADADEILGEDWRGFLSLIYFSINALIILAPEKMSLFIDVECQGS
jgi:hypothetical protein